MPKFEPLFTHNFLQEQAYWVLTKPETAAKINALVAAVLKEPFQGIGKPEPLRYSRLKGCWSRRITKEHRLVYLVQSDTITFLQCRYHY
jgi:toxin YoeB